MSNITLNPGDIKINSATLINKDGEGIDIRRIITQINLYESINQPFITGDVTVSDSVGIIESMPLVGEEQIILDLETPGQPNNSSLRRRHRFLVYKLGGVESIAIKNKLFVLNIVSIEMVTDLNCKISKTFKGNLSSIVSKLISGQPGLNTDKLIDADSTTNNHTFTANFWTPIQTIKYICDHSIGDGNNPSFVFYEDKDGFKFKTLDSLYKQPIYAAFVRDMKMRPAIGTESLDEEYTKVLDISTKIHHDYLERLRSGFYASSAITFDLYSKVVNNTERLAVKNWKTEGMNKSYPISETLQALPEAVYKAQVHSRELYNGFQPLPLEHHLKRMHKVSLLSASTTNIQVFGRMDYTVGQKINLTVYREVDYNTKLPDNKAIVDEILSGNYSITALNHNMTSQTHVTNMELSKESFVKQI